MHTACCCSILSPARTFLTSCGVTSWFPPGFDSEWSHHLAHVHGTQLHAFSPCLPLLRMLLPLETGAWRLAGEKICTDGNASAFRKWLAVLGLSWSVMGESTDSWARAEEWKFLRRKRSLHRTVLLVTWKFAPSSRRRATNQRFLSLLGKGCYDRLVKNSSSIYWKSEEDNSNR